MWCRHTLPDWHRYVDPAAEAAPIFAACRLLVHEGERREDPRAIACSYWGHQPDCPLYEGPGAGPRPPAAAAPRPASLDVPVEAASVWPVRPPGARDGMRLVLIGLGLGSIGLLVWTAVLGLSWMRGTTTPTSFMTVALATAVVSIATHAMATLRIWARR